MSSARSNKSSKSAKSSGARASAKPVDEASRAQSWTFLSNHAHLLIALAAEPDLLLREAAIRIGITERAVQKLLVDLEHEGLVTRERVGRRNSYQLHLDQPLRHPLEAHRKVSELIELVAGGGRGAKRGSPGSRRS